MLVFKKVCKGKDIIKSATVTAVTPQVFRQTL